MTYHKAYQYSTARDLRLSMALVAQMKQVCALLPVGGLNDRQRVNLKNCVDNLPLAIRQSISSFLDEHPYYEIKGYTGKGVFADAPWIGFHDIRDIIDSSPTKGIYVTLIFRVDGSGVVLSLQHGTEDKSSEQIREVTLDLKKKVASPGDGFAFDEPRIRPLQPFPKGKTYVRPQRYELGSVLKCEYEAATFPKDAEFISGLVGLLRCYKQYANGLQAEDSEELYQGSILTESNPDNLPAEPGPRPQLKKAVGSTHPPRDVAQGNKALADADYHCELDSTHSTFIRPNGKQYMEKHHLIPMERFEDFSKSIDHWINIVSLCPTCHRKLHHSEAHTKKATLRNLIDIRLASLTRCYGVNQSQLEGYYKL